MTNMSTHLIYYTKYKHLKNYITYKSLLLKSIILLNIL